MGEDALKLSLDISFPTFWYSHVLETNTGGSLLKDLVHRFLTPLIPVWLYVSRYCFSTVFVSMEPEIWRFSVHLVLVVMVSFVSISECISTHLFHPVCIGARLACFCLAYVPAKPNMFSAIDAKSIMSLLSRLRIHAPIFVFRTMKNSTIFATQNVSAN